MLNFRVSLLIGIGAVRIIGPRKTGFQIVRETIVRYAKKATSRTAILGKWLLAGVLRKYSHMRTHYAPAGAHPILMSWTYRRKL
jgi:hypothetical protein